MSILERLKGSGGGSEVTERGGVGNVGGVGACRNVAAAGRVGRGDGRHGMGGPELGFKNCGALLSM
jgi:hypothetical protein